MIRHSTFCSIYIAKRLVQFNSKGCLQTGSTSKARWRRCLHRITKPVGLKISEKYFEHYLSICHGFYRRQLPHHKESCTISTVIFYYGYKLVCNRFGATRNHIESSNHPESWLWHTSSQNIFIA